MRAKAPSRDSIASEEATDTEPKAKCGKRKKNIRKIQAKERTKKNRKNYN